MNEPYTINKQSNLIEKAFNLDDDTFCKDITTGLLAKNKYLSSKYFYDTRGDELFSKIMKSPEYYLSRCELEILKDQSAILANTIVDHLQHFDLIELGPGDASKSIHLLQSLKNTNRDFDYIPIDISKHIIEDLEERIPNKVRDLKVKGLAGEYLSMLKKHADVSSAPKVILFLGSSIGNFMDKDALAFCKEVNNLLNLGDLFLIGFDLKKDPNTILAAYNDKEGLTREFNLNLLKRINRELGADFDINSFTHFPTYNPLSGLCKSYLISQKQQTVFIKKSNTSISFQKYEEIFMENSKKYTIEETEKLARDANFTVERNFLDSKHWFLDSLWRK